MKEVILDTETTGLDINFSQIIQIGSVLTDSNFKIIPNRRFYIRFY